MFSDSENYSRWDMIWHNIVQVYVSLAVQRLVIIMLLYVDSFHFNIALCSGRFHFLTIGAYFCESLLHQNVEYYHWQQCIFGKTIIIDYVVTSEHAQQKGWVTPDSSNEFTDRISMITVKRISSNSEEYVVTTKSKIPLESSSGISVVRISSTALK